MNRKSSVRLVLATLALYSAAAFAADDDEKKKGKFDAIEFRSVGPAAGGRVSRAVGVPGDPLVYYAATAQGGVWKSTNGGTTWKPIFDDQPVASIGSIAVAPSDANVVYVGSGEANIRGNTIAGQGIFRSTDAGKTWQQVWKQVGQIGTMIVHPTNPDVAFAAVLGHAFGPNPERGIYRTVDGGATWKRVLYKDDLTGASDVAVDPSNPRVLFAGLWQARRRPWELTSGGPGSGLWRSTDGGDTWKQLTGKGLPDGEWGKVGVAVAPSDSQRVYALIEAEKGGLYRSDDGGSSWNRINAHHALTQRAWYYSTLTVDPTNADVVWFPQVPLLRTIDGGKSVQFVGGWHHGDLHDAWIDPQNPKRMIVANDGGVDLSWDGGASWYAPKLPIAQFYNIDASSHDPYHVGGTMQDEGTASGPSNSLRFEGITATDWLVVGGGEAGDFAYDRADPDIVYAGEYSGIISALDSRTGNAQNVCIYPFNPSGHGAEDLRVRFQWTAPIAVSPHDSSELYHGANVLFRSKDRGATWSAISPDLTRDDKSKQKWSGGPITGDNTGVEVYDTIFSVALSPAEKGLVWVGSDDGLVHVTRDDGANWSNVTPKGVPEWGTVEAIEPSPHEAGTAWLVVDAHRMDDQRPYLFRTDDYGKSWQNLSSGLPQDAPLFVVREDPVKEGLLFAGNERGVLFSRDGGKAWEKLAAGLPTVKVSDIVVKGDDLVVGTSGRSLWILDDFSALRDWTPAVDAAAVHLVGPSPVKRWTYGGSWGDEGAAPNPPRGAVFDYFLKSKLDEKAEAKLEIFDAKGRLVRTLTQIAETPEFPEDDPDEPGEAPKPALSTDAGLHRATWNLRWQGAERLDRAKIDTGGYQNGPRAVPGRYTLKLTAGGEQATGELEIVADPRSKVSQADLEAQLESSLASLDAIRKTLDDVRAVRAIRAQASDLASRLEKDAPRKSLVEAAKRAVEKCDALEAKLHNPKAEVSYDILAQKGGTQLLSNLVFLYETLADGDGPPTQGAKEVGAELEKQRVARHAEVDALRAGEVAEIERLAKELGVPRIVTSP